MRTDARHYATDVLLRDGSSIHLRAIRPDDKQRLLALFSRLSPQSVYFRFFQAKATPHGRGTAVLYRVGLCPQCGAGGNATGRE
jgi:hypothetical protein